MTTRPEGDSAFAPPRSPTLVPHNQRARTLWFLRTRALRLAAAAGIWGLWAQIMWPASGWEGFGAGAVLGLSLWLPTTLLLFRIVFFPGEPDLRLVDVVGRSEHPEDHRWLRRVVALEHALGTLPLLLFAALVGWRPGSVAPWLPLVFVPLVAAALWQQMRALRGVLLTEAAVDLAIGQPEDSLWWLQRLQRLPGGMSNAAWHVQAVAHARLGHPTASLQALERISDPEGWNVDELRRRITSSGRP